MFVFICYVSIQLNDVCVIKHFLYSFIQNYLNEDGIPLVFHVHSVTDRGISLTPIKVTRYLPHST